MKWLLMFCVYNASMIYFFFFFLCFSVILNTWLRSTWRSTTWGIGFEWFLPTRTGMFMNWDISTLPRMRARRKIEVIVFYIEASSIRGFFFFFLFFEEHPLEDLVVLERLFIFSSTVLIYPLDGIVFWFSKFIFS